LTKQDAPARFFSQRAGKGVPVSEPAKALLEQLDKIIYMEWPVFFSQYLDGQIDQRLTSSPAPEWKRFLGLGFSSQLPDSPQLVFELKFKHLKKDLLKLLGFHKLPPPVSYGDENYNQSIVSITEIITDVCQEKND